VFTYTKIPSCSQAAKEIAPAPMRLRWATRESTHGAAGYALGYGLRVGYWPCLRGVYVQVALHRWRIEIWSGLPSYAHCSRQDRP
jgi:hypothetical protein